eukprot:TRINITY_DN96800_c0_g1_i1.p1 TRINITY_DN96800_c0_g1~~TRINITY_DN96800_c0_g1_i1.p1  ORF type:complete len:105 (+),score=26.31 TRINITY_DN96800_c0_g1_i1:60-374(+)
MAATRSIFCLALLLPAVSALGSASGEHRARGDLMPSSYPVINAHMTQRLSYVKTKWAVLEDAEQSRLLEDLEKQIDVHHMQTLEMVAALRTEVQLLIKQLGLQE